MTHQLGPLFGILNVIGMTTVLVCFEIKHRYVITSEINWKVKEKPNMSSEEFDKAVECGQQLVILD